MINTPDNEIINSVVYLPGEVLFLIDKLDSDGNVRFKDFAYSFIGDETYQTAFDIMFDPREDFGITVDAEAEPGMKYAGMGKLEGWISKKIFSKLGKSDLRAAFIDALSKGRASAFGDVGIKELAGKGIQVGMGSLYYNLRQY